MEPSVISAFAGIQATHVFRLLNGSQRANALTSDYVESLDFVKPNPTSFRGKMGEGTTTVITAKYRIHVTWLSQNF